MSRVSLDFLARRLRAVPVEWHCRVNLEYVCGAELYPLVQRTSPVRVPEFWEECLKQDRAITQGHWITAQMWRVTSGCLPGQALRSSFSCHVPQTRDLPLLSSVGHASIVPWPSLSRQTSGVLLCTIAPGTFLLVEPASTEGAIPLAFNVGAYRHALVWTSFLFIITLLRNRHDTLSEDFTVYVRGRLMDFNQRGLSHMVYAFFWLGAGHGETLHGDAPHVLPGVKESKPQRLRSAALHRSRSPWRVVQQNRQRVSTSTTSSTLSASYSSATKVYSLRSELLCQRGCPIRWHMESRTLCTV